MECMNKDFSVVDLGLNLSLYRIRFVEEELSKDKRTNIPEFGYNPNPKNIKRMRLNLPGEQVLYTSTNPLVSYKETISPKSLNLLFYLSVWSKKDKEEKCTCFLSSFESCPKEPDCNSNKIKREYCKKLNAQDLQTIAKMGKILEKQYSQNSKDKYKESSLLASEILKRVACIMTPSAKEPQEVNITCNKQFTDNSLILNRVYLCRPFPSKASIFFRVEKIGVVNNNKVIWYNWNIKEGSLVYGKNEPIPQDDKDILYPNVMNSIFDYHKGIYKGEIVNFKIDLVPEEELS